MPASVAEDYIYLDYAATAPLSVEAAEAMAPFQEGGRANLICGTNANSLHSPGRVAFEAMETARRSVAKDLGARRPDEIIFTSGATEADDGAIMGLTEAALERRRIAGTLPEHPRVIVSAIEHDAVLAPAKRLEARGVEVVRLQPDRNGFITPERLQEALDADTLLVSVQMANSELGSIQPIAELARLAHDAGSLFHTDAVQALGKVPVDVGALGVDAASFSAHKIGGPKGVGALYLKARTPFAPFMLGGGQENGLRSGTQNVPGIVGFAAALHAAVEGVDTERVRLASLRDRLYRELSAFEGVTATVPDAAGSERFLPNIVHVLSDDFESQTLILRYDKLGFGVSGGSACSSHSLEPSHVLKAIGIDGDRAQGALRISMGRYTDEADVDAFIAASSQVFDW